MSWQYNVDSSRSGRGKFRWTGSLPDQIKARDYDDGWVMEWVVFPRLSQEAMDISRTQMRTAYDIWAAAEDAKPYAPGECRRRDVNTMPARTCPCCGATIRFGDCRFHSLLPDGVCLDCWHYLTGMADSVRVCRRPTAEEVLLLPVDQLSGDARALLHLLRQYREGSP